MAIHESARFSNIERSVYKYIQDSLEGAAGLPTKFPAANIQWPGFPFDTEKVSYFLRVHMTDDEGIFFSRVEGSNPGSLKYPRLFLEVFIKPDLPREQNKQYLLTDTLDTVKSYFLQNSAITVLNYQGSGLTDLGRARVRKRQPTTPKGDGWHAGGFMISLEWIEQDVAA